MALNVNRNVLDPFYRYKMPRLLAKVEGKGNGIKTVIANMTEIAKALERPPTYPTKYFGCELGAQTQFDLKNERYIVNGEHDAGRLQEILDGFIKKFVLCSACDNPETTLTVQKNKGVIHSKCKACGNAAIIDPKHKLSTFILKNPPKEQKDEAGKKENGNGVIVESAPTDEAVIDNNSGSASDDADDWAEPVDAVDCQQAVRGQMAKLTMNADLDKPEDQRLDMMERFFVKAKKENMLQDPKLLLLEAERLDLKSKAPLLLCNLLFDRQILEQLKQYRNLFIRFTHNDNKAQRHFLGGIELLIDSNWDTMLARTAHIIKAIYDQDICTEESIISWGKKPSSKYVKKERAKEILAKAAPVIEWLQNASEESGDEEDNDVEFDDRARRVGTVEVSSNTNGISAPMKTAAAPTMTNGKADHGDELDIDDI